MKDCVFCKIINNELPSKKLYEDDEMLIFENINKSAKLHYLAIPKNHYAHLSEASNKQAEVLGKILVKIPQLQQILHIENGYRLIINQGKDGGQEIEHLHIHILGGEKLPNF